MTKRTSAKHKIDRRMGENIWGRPKSPVNKREYGPGQHGQRRKGKMSDFGTQLRAKQKLKGYYGDLTEKQFRKTYEEAARRKGDTSENLIGLLESRLDAIVYRAKFVSTPFAARQFVNHGHVNVKGVRTNIGSYVCKAGDVIEVRQKSKQLTVLIEATQLAERDGIVQVSHGGGVSTAYGHIVNGGIKVSRGQSVVAGQLIALVGSTGNSTGCHLHFETRINGGSTDPVPFMSARGVSLR